MVYLVIYWNLGYFQGTAFIRLRHDRDTSQVGATNTHFESFVNRGTDGNPT